MSISTTSRQGSITGASCHFCNVRHKLEDDPAQPRYLITETAVGYRFVIPV